MDPPYFTKWEEKLTQSKQAVNKGAAWLQQSDHFIYHCVDPEACIYTHSFVSTHMYKNLKFTKLCKEEEMEWSCS